MTESILRGLSLLTLLIVPSADLVAQEQPKADVLLAALRFIMAEEDVPDLAPGHLVVDVESTFWWNVGGTSDQLGRALRAAAVRFAATVGARPGALSEIMTCPDEAPSVAEFQSGDWGCRFGGGAKVVLQLDEPRPNDGGMLVWIGVWRLIEDTSGAARYVSARGHEVELEHDPSGQWQVTGIRRTSFSRW